MTKQAQSIETVIGTTQGGESASPLEERARIRVFVISSHQAQGLARAQQIPDPAISTACNRIPAAPRDGFLDK